MSNTALTMRQLVEAEEVSEAEIDAAVDAYLADPTIGVFGLGVGFTLNLSATVKADRWALTVIHSRGMGERTRRTAVRAALLQARPNRR